MRANSDGEVVAVVVVVVVVAVVVKVSSYLTIIKPHVPKQELPTS